MYSIICCNYKEHDPISFNDICDLAYSQLFFIKQPSTNKVYAYDSVAWLRYFLSSTLHPITRTEVEPSDIWQCYYSACTVLPHDNKTLQKYRSVKVAVSMVDKSIIFKTHSPLFRFMMMGMKSIPKNELEKVFIVQYVLVDSQDNTRKITPLNELNVDCAYDMTVSFC